MTQERKENDAVEVFKTRLKAARELRKLSQGELAEKSGLPPSSVSHFEAGNRKPSFDNLRKLARALAVTTDYLLGRVDTPDQPAVADKLYRHAQKLSDSDRELAAEFIEMLAKRGGDK